MAATHSGLLHDGFTAAGCRSWACDSTRWIFLQGVWPVLLEELVQRMPDKLFHSSSSDARFKQYRSVSALLAASRSPVHRMSFQ